MSHVVAWGDDLFPDDKNGDSMAMESMASSLVQGAENPNSNQWFKPVNIAVQNGLFYVTIYACTALDGSTTAQQLAIWLASLKETDHLHLTITALTIDVPPFALVSLLSAVSATKATIDIHLDQAVFDHLAYFYLLADKITKGVAGALFIPPYFVLRESDTSGPYKATIDVYKWIVERAVEKGLLTAEEGSSLGRGTHVIVPDDRFQQS